MFISNLLGREGVWSPSQTQAAQRIVEAIAAPDPIILLTGETGCGKSTVLRLAMEQLRWPHLGVRIARPFPTAAALRRQMAAVLGLSLEHAGPDAVTEALRRWWIATHGQCRLVLGIDDADSLPDPTLHFVDLLAAPGGTVPAALRIVLTGGSDLHSRIVSHLPRLSEAMTVVPLAALDAQEARYYLDHVFRGLGQSVRGADLDSIITRAGGRPGQLWELALSSVAATGAGHTADAGPVMVPETERKPVMQTRDSGQSGLRVRHVGVAAAVLLSAIAAWQFALRQHSPPQQTPRVANGAVPSATPPRRLTPDPSPAPTAASTQHPVTPLPPTAGAPPRPSSGTLAVALIARDVADEARSVSASARSQTEAGLAVLGRLEQLLAPPALKPIPLGAPSDAAAALPNQTAPAAGTAAVAAPASATAASAPVVPKAAAVPPAAIAEASPPAPAAAPLAPAKTGATLVAPRAAAVPPAAVAQSSPPAPAVAPPPPAKAASTPVAVAPGIAHATPPAQAAAPPPPPAATPAPAVSVARASPPKAAPALLPPSATLAPGPKLPASASAPVMKPSTGVPAPSKAATPTAPPPAKLRVVLRSASGPVTRAERDSIAAALHHLAVVVASSAAAPSNARATVLYFHDQDRGAAQQVASRLQSVLGAADPVEGHSHTARIGTIDVLIRHH